MIERNYFIPLNSVVLSDERFDLYDKVILSTIMNLCKEKGFCYASNKTISQLLKISERKVQYSITKLRKIGILTSARRIFGKRSYRTLSYEKSYLESKTKSEELIDQKEILFFDYDWLHED